MTVFQNRGTGKRRMAFGAPYPGKIIPVHLKEIGGELLAQKDSFLCAAQGREPRHRVHQAYSARGSSAAKVSSCSGCRAMGSRSFTRAAPSISVSSRLAKRCASTRAVSSRSSRALTMTSSTSGTSRARCSAVKACSSPRCAGRGTFGCSRCRSAGSPVASSPRSRAWVAAAVKKAQCSAAWAGSLTATIRSLNLPGG